MSEEKLTYRQQAEELRRQPKSGLVISYYRSVPELLNAYILAKCGALFSSEPLYHPEVWSGRDMSTDISDNALLLNHREKWHPDLLRDVISLAAGAGEISEDERVFLVQLQRTAAHAYSRHESKWFEARAGILKMGSATQLHLNDYLTTLMDINFADPHVAFRKGIEAITRLEQHQLGFAVLNPIPFKVPILKNEGDEEADVVDQAEFKFDKVKSLYLPFVHYRIVIGGAPNSGKSTFTASLSEHMRYLIRVCVSDGILEEGQVKIATYDLDSTSPTVHSIASGRELTRGIDQRWSIRRSEATARAFADLSSSQDVNIALGDLPGGGPNTEVTYILASNSRFSIIVDRNQGEEMKKWRDFFKGLSNHNTLVLAHSRLREEGRESGVRGFTSALRRTSKPHLLWGRVTGLGRSLRTDDPFIGFAAHVLLFDYLPGAAIKDANVQSEIHLSLNNKM